MTKNHNLKMNSINFLLINGIKKGINIQIHKNKKDILINYHMKLKLI